MRVVSAEHAWLVEQGLKMWLVIVVWALVGLAIAITDWLAFSGKNLKRRSGDIR